MDFPSLATVIATLSVITYGVVDRVKAAVPRLNTWQVTLVSAVVGLVMPFLVAYSSFGPQVAVGDTTLDLITGWGLLVLGLLGLGGSSVLNQTVGSGGSNGTHGAVGNIGVNEGTG